MPEENVKARVKLEAGTVKEVTRILAEERGENITYDGVAKRIRRQNHLETFRLAVAVSNRIRERREAEKEEFMRLAKQNENMRAAS
ncbi:MAG: hypothetical protein HGA77_04715 [Chlorobiaceae bacterium]|nr:hypothetical protein [Chlorobiaceae bacterium]